MSIKNIRLETSLRVTNELSTGAGKKTDSINLGNSLDPEVGNAEDQANKVYAKEIDFLATESKVIDLYDFEGEKGSFGVESYALAGLKALYLENLGDDEMHIGNDGTAGEYTGFLVAGSVLKLAPGASVFLVETKTGMPVTDTSSHLLKVENKSSGAAKLKVGILGVSS